ncbi:aldo/keto reductase [Elioraea sp. Yellowstone]|jgi:2,5-diketo-D-gluconate reductase B|uniref:aldo/keto reductase n=1 Tax=Elioraea sp. Yellowstone TaxID=2592070 RepID=UPI00114EF13E|nr:aldo/keto reductase [Elioraea sp. Yellowstone]TQF78257.1 aldo/keto reductase [Elioraea sp. Yellowstone]
MHMIETAHLAMPKLGFGTWALKGADCARAVAEAIGLGYRHIDTAEMYDNEEAVGQGIRASGVARDLLFVTTKVWWTNLAAPEAALAASLKRLRLDHVDLFLIHWPNPAIPLASTLAAMVGLKERGLARAIGVANFPAGLLREAVSTGAPIACNQVEYHVMLSQEPVLRVARAHDIVVTAYSPLGKGGLAEDPTLAAIGRRHGVTGAQVALAWLLEQDRVAAIPKSGRIENMRANLAALDLRLTDEDRAAIAALPKNRRFVNPSWSPAWDQAA